MKYQVALKEYYKGKEGAKKLAREIGYCLDLDRYSKKEKEDTVKSSYSYICVRFYDLKPEIDAKEWNAEIYRVLRLK
jgi:hypothetical protein